MICSECNKELKDKTNLKNIKNLTLPIISIIISTIGLIGYWIVFIYIQKLTKSISLGYYTEDADILISKFKLYYFILSCFSSLLFFSIIILLIAQYRKKSLFGLIIGLIICVYIIALPYIQMPIQNLLIK
jgi:hypothetical protein